MTVSSAWHALTRCKSLADDGSSGGLARVLTLMDLTALGVGSTLGLGVYVLAGSVAKTVAGPAVCISFLVAAIASAFAGLCYAEFAARVPKAGSAYIYSYVSVGEFIAFTIGWNLILEYVIGTASVAKGMSNYIDALTNNSMRTFFRDAMPMEVSFLSKYPDFFAFLLVLVISVLLAVGVKESARLNNVFTGLNLITVVTVVIAGATKADIANWQISPENVTEEYRDKIGTGGFAPFGFAGIMAGAARCFFGFVGFDCVATTGEEAKNPQKNIPLSIVLSLIIIFLSYFSVSTVLTMMWPYYLQDADAPFPHVFSEVGMTTVKWLVTVGAIFALCTSLLGAMFPLPRVLYAMGKDGVIYRFLSSISPRTMTPVIATAVSGILAGVMATLFDLEQLIDMMSIGTLMAYTIVAVSVLVLRYQEDLSSVYASASTDKQYPSTMWSILKQTFNLNGIKYPTNLSYVITKICIFLFFVLALALCGTLVWSSGDGQMVGLIVIGVVLIVSWIVIARQPMQDVKLAFKVPLVPLIPCISILMNLYLMVQLDHQTWIRFIIWLIVGYFIYFSYGIWNSSERKNFAKRQSDISLSRNADIIMSPPELTEEEKYYHRQENYARQITKF